MLLFLSLFVLFCFFFFFFFHFKFHFLSTGRGSLFSNLLLCKIIDMACYIAMVFMSMTVSFVVLFGIFNCSSNILIEGLCVFAIAPGGDDEYWFNIPSSIADVIKKGLGFFSFSSNGLS